MNDEQKETKAVDIGSIFAIIDDQKLTGIEVDFNNNLNGASTAADVLNVMTNQLHNSHWMVRTIMKVANRDAQVKSERDQSGDTGDQVADVFEPDDQAE